MKPTADEIRLENQKMKRLRGMVMVATTLLSQEEMSLTDAVRLIQGVRAQALELFPGKESAWDLIYAPRFARILRERFGIEYPES